MDRGILSESQKCTLFGPQGKPKVFVLNRYDSGNDSYAAGVLVVHKKSMLAHICAYRYSGLVN